MWKYQQPDFALFLLGELQKQQQGSVFCDTLLQTEGVCVPAHSCVLAALSPIFSRILSTSPAPPAGKNRLLSLDAVRSHALLKLVGFLYSGEMEIESQSEHEDVMAAAHKLGLKNLIEKKRVWVERGVEDVGRCWKEAGAQTHESVKGKESVSVPLPLEKRSGTFYNANNVPGTSVLEADLSFDESSSSRGFNWISDVTVPPLTDVTEAPASNQCKTKAKRWKLRDGRIQNSSWQQNQVKLLSVEGGKLNQPGVMESRNVSGKDFRKLLEAVSLPKNASSEQKLDKLKVKIKLRRRGACWESNLLVSVQGESESDEVKDCGPQTLSCPSSVLAGQSLGTLTPPTDLPISPSDCSTHLSSDKPCPHTSNDSSMSSILDLPALSSSPPQADESDEHIAMLLEDMFMMGLNILPLMPLDKNLDEQEIQLDPLQEEKGGVEISAQGSCSYVRGCEEEVRETTRMVTPVRSPQQRYKELEQSSFHNHSKPETVKPLAQSTGELHASLSNMNKDTNLETMEMDPDLMLTTKTTAVPKCPVSETGEMSDLEMTPIPEDRLDFILLKCLSPLESDDNDVPTQEPSGPSQGELSEPHAQNLSSLSESPPILDFPLGSVIDSSPPHPCPDSNVSQDQSCPDKQKLRRHNNITTGNGSSKDQADIVGEFPKQRMTRRRLAKLKEKEDGMCQNLAKESRASSRLSKTKCADRVKERNCGNVKLTTINTRGASTRMSRPVDANRKPIAGVKRKQESCLPLSKKMSLNATSKQHEHEDHLPKVQVTAGTVKRGRGRPPRSKEDAAKSMQRCNNAKTINQAPIHCSTASVQFTALVREDCKVKKTKIANELEQDNKQEPNKQTKKDLTKIKEADVNGNYEQTKQNAHVKYSGQTRRSSIVDQIFHQTSNACRRSLLIGQQLSSNSQDSTCSPHRLQGPLEKSGESFCGENETGTSVLINREEIDTLDNQVRLQMSQSNTSNIVQCPVKVGDRSVTDFQNGLEDIQDQSIKINPFIYEDLTKDVTDVDHAMLPEETDSRANNNKQEVMERIDMTRIVQEMQTSVCIKSTQAEHLENKTETAVSKEEDLRRCKVVQPKETIEKTETKVQRLAPCASDVRSKESDDVDVEDDQYSFETLLDEEDLSTIHSAQASTTGDTLNAAVTPTDRQVLRNGPSVQTEVSNQSNSHSPRENNEDHSTVQTPVASSVSKDDHSEEEAIEVDVLGGSADSLSWPLAAGQTITLSIESLQEQEVEMDVTEEEEVDVTGEETE